MQRESLILLVLSGFSGGEVYERQPEWSKRLDIVA